AFWGADDEDISEGGIQRTPPVPQDEDEREPMFVQAHDPDYVSEPIYPEYIPLEDEHEFPVEEQPLPPVDSPTAESPGYVTESDPEEDPEEYKDDETKDGPVDYPMDGENDGDDDDGDSSGDDVDGEDEDDEDEEEEHLASADAAIVVPVDEPVFPPEGTKPVIPPPSTDITIGARITVRPQTSISLPPEAEVERLLTMDYLNHHHHYLTITYLLITTLTGERLTLKDRHQSALIDQVTAAFPFNPHTTTTTISLHYHQHLLTNRDDIPKSELPPETRVGFVQSRVQIRGARRVPLLCTYQKVKGMIMGLSAEAVPEIAPMIVGRTEVNTRVTELAELHEHDTQDLYALLEDAQDSRRQYGWWGGGAYASREAWAHSIGLSQETHQELQTHRDNVYAHETHLQAHQT
ncbi:hypothetical protein Tco_1468881, partial [Tanacetum coccineum]